MAAAARAKLGRAGIEVNYGCQVEDIVDKGAFVETTLMIGVRFRIRCYLIGADGAQSIVRGHVNYLPGHTYPKPQYLRPPISHLKIIWRVVQHKLCVGKRERSVSETP